MAIGYTFQPGGDAQNQTMRYNQAPQNPVSAVGIKSVTLPQNPVGAPTSPTLLQGAGSAGLAGLLPMLLRLLQVQAPAGVPTLPPSVDRAMPQDGNRGYASDQGYGAFLRNEAALRDSSAGDRALPDTGNRGSFDPHITFAGGAGTAQNPFMEGGFMPTSIYNPREILGGTASTTPSPLQELGQRFRDIAANINLPDVPGQTPQQSIDAIQALIDQGTNRGVQAPTFTWNPPR